MHSAGRALQAAFFEAILLDVPLVFHLPPLFFVLVFQSAALVLQLN